MIKTFFGARPLEVELFPVNCRQIIRIRQNIQEVPGLEGEICFSADEFESVLPANTEVTEELINSIKEADRSKTAINIRKIRDELLEESDKRMVSDFPCDHEAWKTYRQALRDIPSQEGFPYNVIFPKKPTD